MNRASRLRKLEASVARPPAAPLAEGANLYRDVEEQIAVVRGRAPGRPSRGLLQLEERLLARRPRRETAVQRLDTGQVPRPSPAPAPAAMPAPAAAAASAFAAPPAWPPAAFAGPVSVEPFGVAEPAPSKSCCREPEPVRAVPPALAVSVERAGPSRRQAADERPPRPSRLSLDQQAAAEAFERDLAAVLGQAKAQAPEDAGWNATVGQARAKAPEAPPGPAVASAASAAPAPPNAPPRNLGHGIFDQMGSAMRYANSFDLGAVDLGARFEAFERELTPSTPARPRPIADVRALNDFDVVADLAELGEPGHPPSAARSQAGALEAVIPEPVAGDGSPTSQERCHG